MPLQKQRHMGNREGRRYGIPGAERTKTTAGHKFNMWGNKKNAEGGI